MIGDRIKKRREALGLSQDDLAQRLGYKSRSSINKMELGVQDVPQRKVKEIARILDVPIGYLLEDDDFLVGMIDMNLEPIPIYAGVSCGTGSWIDGIPEEYVGIPKSMTFTGESFANPADGDSMLPGIKCGDLLIFQATPEVNSGEIGAFRHNGEFLCKRYKVLRDGSIWLISDNPEYDPIHVLPEDDFATLGKYRMKLSYEQ